MKEIYCTDGTIVLVDDEDFDRVATREWYFNASARSVVTVGHKDRRTLGPFILNVADRLSPVYHVTANILDFRKSNLSLRQSDKQREKQNSSVRNIPPRNNRTGFKGVYECRRNKSRPWKAGIQKAGKSRHVGIFPTPEEAARAYDKAAFAEWGTDCYLNFPEDYGLPARAAA